VAGDIAVMIHDSIYNIASLFVASNIQYKNLYGFHNQVYKIVGDRNFILRIASPIHRSKEETLSEIDFLLFLKERGISLSSPIKGLDGEFVYEINNENEKYIVSAFEIAKGDDFRTRHDNDTRLNEVGRMLGKLHKYSKLYTPHNISMRRKWNESQHLKKAGNLFENTYPELKIKFDEFIAEMNTIPKNYDSYGLIHGDFLFSNYFFDGSNITIIDFDECEYSWFIYDIAVCMYYYLLGGSPSELDTKTQEAERLLYNLLSGYIEENTIDIFWIKNIDLFFRMREFVLLSTISEIPYNCLEGWQKSFFDGAFGRQINNKPFIQADFVKTYNDMLKQ
jgi:Putative homoserine kinase type II (protein kinase fold)